MNLKQGLNKQLTYRTLMFLRKLLKNKQTSNTTVLSAMKPSASNVKLSRSMMDILVKSTKGVNSMLSVAFATLS